MTAKQMDEFAAKVANDINENIDCRETRKQLREVVRYFAMDACVQHSWKKLAEGKVITARFAIAVLLPFVRASRMKGAKEAIRIAEIAAKL